MKLAQLKWIGLAIAGDQLSAGGAIVVAAYRRGIRTPATADAVLGRGRRCRGRRRPTGSPASRKLTIDAT